MPVGEVADYYDLLGVPRGAGAEDIERAWRKLCFRWHPDRNVGQEDAAHARFLELSEAYAVLSDPAARAAYDRLWRRLHGGDGGGPDSEVPPRDRFADVVREASEVHGGRAGEREGRAFEAEVAAVLRELAGVQGGRRPTSRTIVALQVILLLASFLAARGIVLALASSGRWEPLELAALATPLPLAVSLVCLRSWILALRSRRLQRSLRPLAERIVLARKRA